MKESSQGFERCIRRWRNLSEQIDEAWLRGAHQKVSKIDTEEDGSVFQQAPLLKTPGSRGQEGGKGCTVTPREGKP